MSLDPLQDPSQMPVGRSHWSSIVGSVNEGASVVTTNTSQSNLSFLKCLWMDLKKRLLPSTSHCSHEVRNGSTVYAIDSKVRVGLCRWTWRSLNVWIWTIEETTLHFSTSKIFFLKKKEERWTNNLCILIFGPQQNSNITPMHWLYGLGPG